MNTSKYCQVMARLNHDHLLDFCTTVREGTIAGASRVLHLSQTHFQHQNRRLERAIRLEEAPGRRPMPVLWA